MSSNALVFVFVLCIAQTTLCGPLKVKSPEVLKLITDIELERNNVEMQLKLLELNSKTAVKSAGYAAKLEVKRFECVVKTVDDDTCSVVARTSLKAAEQAQGELKLCNSKEGTKLLKVQITTFLKTLQSQAHAIEGYCSLMHTEEAEVELCTAMAIAAIREQLNNTVNFLSSSIEAVSKNDDECISNALQKVKDAVSEGTANIDSCVNPTTPKAESEESNESESENSESAESGEQSATTEGAAQEGSEGPVEGSEAPVEGSDAPVEGSEGPVEGSEAPAEGEATAAEEEVGGAATEGAAAQEGSGNTQGEGDGEAEEGENAQEPTEVAAQENGEETVNQQEGGEPGVGGGEDVQGDGEQQAAATEGSEQPQKPAETAPEQSENSQEPVETAPEQSENPQEPIETAPEQSEIPQEPVETAPEDNNGQKEEQSNSGA